MARFTDEFGFEYPIPAEAEQEGGIVLGRHRSCRIAVPPLPANELSRDYAVMFPNDLIKRRAAEIKYSRISKLHAMVRASEGRISISDFDSTNGTYIQDARLSADESAILKDGDKIWLGGREPEGLKLTYHEK